MMSSRTADDARVPARSRVDDAYSSERPDHTLLIDAPTLAALAPDTVCIVDCRFTLTDPARGRRDFAKAHIAGAAYADLDRDLSDLSRKGLGRHPLPNPEAFAKTVTSWGWHAGQRIITYDASGGAMAAARAWWMLTSMGITASVLDGGWQAWLAAGLPTAVGISAARAPSDVALSFDRTRMVDYMELEKLRLQPSALVLDARGAARFRGDIEPLDRVAGHIPGASNRPFGMNLDITKHFKAADVLRAQFDELLAGRAPEQVVHMCGSGVYACHNMLAMEVAGLHGSRVFIPSWSGWSSDPARSVATGD